MVNGSIMKTSVKKMFLPLFCFMVALLFAWPVHAADDTYHYPGYDVNASGYVDLMDYTKQITVTVGGQEYTTQQLADLKKAGTPVKLKIGDEARFNFQFCLTGRAYRADDPTMLDEDASTKVIYTNGTTYLNGTTIAPSSTAILDDSALMKENTTADNTFLRMDIAWLLDVCPGDFQIKYTDGRVSFEQRDHYLYVYFPNGIGNNTYANPGHFSISVTLTKEVDTIHVPGGKGYYVPGSDGWDIELPVQQDESNSASGDITSYGDIIVYKLWEPAGQPHPDATIVLTYTANGQQYKTTRKLSGNKAQTSFTIQDFMSDCHLEEDMTGLDNYVSNLQVSEDGKTYTFTNYASKTVYVSKREVQGVDELPGAKLTLYKTEADGSETKLDEWLSETTPHAFQLQPGSYRLHESAAPKGYAVSQDTKFTVNNDMTLTSDTADAVDGDTVRIYDKLLSVKLKKVDSQGNAVSGAVLALIDKNTGKEIDRWTTDGSAHVITKQTDSGELLVAGHTYILREISAPSGFQLAADMEFIFNGDGTIPGHGYVTVSMTDLREGENVPTPTPTDGTSQPTPTPNPGDATPTTNPNGGDSTPVPGTSGDGSNLPLGQNGRPIVKTGDSPLMWLWLVMGVVYLAGAIWALVHYFRRLPAGEHKRTGRNRE